MPVRQLDPATINRIAAASIHGHVWLREKHESDRFEAGLTALRRFFAEEQGKPAPDFVEQRFSFMLGNDRVNGTWDRVDRTPDTLQANGGGAGQPAHQRVGISGRYHAGGKNVAVLVNQPLAVAV